MYISRGVRLKISTNNVFFCLNIFLTFTNIADRDEISPGSSPFAKVLVQRCLEYEGLKIVFIFINQNILWVLNKKNGVNDTVLLNTQNK